MAFNTYLFIMAFLPIFVIGYFLCNRASNGAGKIFIIFTGAVFYCYGGWNIAAILGISILLNMIFALIIEKTRNKKLFLVISIVLNIALLLYFKYLNFAIVTINQVFHTMLVEQQLFLPLGISFFTFQQIMYLLAVYRKEILHVNILDYFSYILFFPKLVMGPLMEAGDFIDQLNDPGQKKLDWGNLSAGLKIFSLGLFKKMVIADTFSAAVNWGFNNISSAGSVDFLLVMLFYTFEIYFDFSGYTDMAVGISSMVNITLPINFDSPYKALSIRDFWKRWHISLTSFFTKNVYFPLGGSRKGSARTYLNIMIVFLVSGLWHGANWTFILWGLIHGMLQVLERIFRKFYDQVPRIIRWVYTFLSVNLLWLLFRSESITQWWSLLKKMFSFDQLSVSDGLIASFTLPESPMIFDLLRLTQVNARFPMLGMLSFVVAAFIICLIPENNYHSLKKTNIPNMVFCAFAFLWAFLCLSTESVFVYNGF